MRRYAIKDTISNSYRAGEGQGWTRNLDEAYTHANPKNALSKIRQLGFANDPNYTIVAIENGGWAEVP